MEGGSKGAREGSREKGLNRGSMKDSCCGKVLILTFTSKFIKLSKNYFLGPSLSLHNTFHCMCIFMGCP